VSLLNNIKLSKLLLGYK